MDEENRGGFSIAKIFTKNIIESDAPNLYLIFK